MAKDATKTPKKLSKSVATTLDTPRRRKMPKYRSLRPSKRIKHQATPVPNSFRIFYHALGHMFRRWKLFGGVLLVYAVFDFVLVRGFGGGLGLAGLKQSIDQLTSGVADTWTTSLGLFGYLVGSTGTTSGQAASVYQLVLAMVASLALIWLLRQTYDKAHEKLRIRDAYYKGMYPLVPFLLVMVVVCLELIPLLAGGTVFTIVVNTGIAVTGLETLLWAVLFFLLTVLSLYMLVSSLMALYIVTLPDMTPMKALRSARELVRYRRWTVLRKLLFLPLALVVIAGAIVLPLIFFITPVAEWVYFAYTIVAMGIIHSFMYRLYRELL